MNQGQEDEREEGGTSPKELLDLAWIAATRSWYVIAFAGLLGLAGGVAFAFSQPNEYSSIAKILVRLGAREQTTVEDSVEGVSPTRWSTSVADEIHILSDPVLAERLARRVGASEVLAPADPTAFDGPSTSPVVRRLHELQRWWFTRSSPVLRPGFNEDSEAAIRSAGASIAGNLDIVNGRATSVIQIRLTTNDPERSQRLLSEFLVICRDRHSEIYDTADELDFIEERLRAVDEELTRLSGEYEDHCDVCKLHDLKGQKAALILSIQKLQDKIRSIRTDKEVSRLELASVKLRLETTPETVTRTVPAPTAPNPEYLSFTAQLRELEGELSRLELDFTPESKAYKSREESLKRRSQALEQRLEETPERIQSGSERLEEVQNATFAQLSQLQRDLEGKLERLDLEFSMNTDSAGAFESELNAMLACEPVHDRYEEQIAQARNRASQLTGAQDRTEALDLMDRDSQLSNLVLVQDPDLPLSKDGPARGKQVGAGLAGGLAIGGALALLRMLLDPKIRYPVLEEGRIGVPVLCVVPERKVLRKLGRRLEKLRRSARARAAERGSRESPVALSGEEAESSARSKA